MENKPHYKYQNWTVNVENGVYWHNCVEVYYTTTEMSLGCEPGLCGSCRIPIDKETFNRLYQVWRSWNWGKTQKTYVNSFYISTSTYSYVYQK